MTRRRRNSVPRAFRTRASPALLDFIEMLRRYHGRYDIKQIFSKGEDICVLYDLKTTGPTVFMSPWYQVKVGKIVSIQTVFDPRAFGPPP